MTYTQVTDDLDDNLAAYHNELANGLDAVDNSHALYTTGGTSTAFTITTTTAPALTTGEKWYVKFNATAGASPTLNRDSKGAKSLKYYNGSGTKQACSASIIVANMIGEVLYDGTDYVLLDPISSVGSDGWTAVVETWTYASASTITIPTDGTTKYQAGMKIRLKQGAGYKYYNARTIAATLLTVFVNTDFTVANAAITDISYSFDETPFGWPERFNYATSPTNLTIGNGSIVATYKVTGKTIENSIVCTLGSTSSVSGLITFNAPVSENTYQLPMCWLQDAGTNTFAGLAALSGGIYYIYAINTSGTYMSVTATSSTVPYTWATSDFIAVNCIFGW